MTIIGREGNFQNFSANKLKWVEKNSPPLQLETGEHRVKPNNCEQKYSSIIQRLRS